MNRTRTLAIGWTRSHDPHGRVTRYHLRTVSNCITSFISGGATKTHAPGWRADGSIRFYRAAPTLPGVSEYANCSSHGIAPTIVQSGGGGYSNQVQ